MKILLISNNYWNFYNFRKGLIYNLINNGHDVSLIANDDSYSVKFEGENLKLYKVIFSSRKVSFFKEIILIIRLFRFIKFIKPDLILTFTIKPNIYASFISRFLNIKVINNITGLGSSFLNNRFIKNITLFLYRISISHSKIIFFQNNFDNELFLKLNIVKKINSEVIPGSGVDTEYFKTKIKIPEKKNIFLFSGRLLKEKGIYDYLKAAMIILKNNISCEFHIIGKLDKNDKSSINKDLLNKYLQNDNIKYFGFVEDSKKYYENSSCVILPSYREGLSKSLLEAASMSRPIITTNVPGCKDVVINSKNGFLVKKSNVDSLVEAINIFINISYKSKILMGNNSRKIAKNKFDIELVISKYLKRIKEMEYNLN